MSIPFMKKATITRTVKSIGRGMALCLMGILATPSYLYHQWVYMRHARNIRAATQEYKDQMKQKISARIGGSDGVLLQSFLELNA